jgi:hypothetical protein
MPCKSYKEGGRMEKLEKEFEVSEAPFSRMQDAVFRHKGRLIVSALALAIIFFAVTYQPEEVRVELYMRGVCNATDTEYPYAIYGYANLTQEHLLQYAKVETGFGPSLYAVLNATNWSHYVCYRSEPSNFTQYADFIEMEGSYAEQKYQDYLRQIREEYGLGNNSTGG